MTQKLLFNGKGSVLLVLEIVVEDGLPEIDDFVVDGKMSPKNAFIRSFHFRQKIAKIRFVKTGRINFHALLVRGEVRLLDSATEHLLHLDGLHFL